MLKKSKKNLLFSIYTRLVCNFVYPELNSINPFNRFKTIKDKDNNIEETDDLNINNELIEYFNNINNEDINIKYTINDDLNNYLENYKNNPDIYFDNNNIKKSNLLVEFLKLSCKITYLIFDLFNQ